MSATIASAREKANGHQPKLRTEIPRSADTNATLIEIVKRLFPLKPSAFLASLIGISERCARGRIFAEREFTADELARLIRSEHGLEFLTAIMVDAQPRWWVRLRATSRVAAIRKEQLRMKEALHEAEELACALARAETALAVSDSDFHRPHIDALGAARGLLSRSLAR
jgi:hypothetical protein